MKLTKYFKISVSSQVLSIRFDCNARSALQISNLSNFNWSRYKKWMLHFLKLNLKGLFMHLNGISFGNHQNTNVSLEWENQTVGMIGGFRTKIPHSEYQWRISPRFEVINPYSFDFSWLSHIGDIWKKFSLLNIAPIVAKNQLLFAVYRKSAESVSFSCGKLIFLQ